MLINVLVHVPNHPPPPQNWQKLRMGFDLNKHSTIQEDLINDLDNRMNMYSSIGGFVQL
jgi:hypothetical protein